MLSTRLSYSPVILIIMLLLLSGRAYSQINDSYVEYYDTSLYIPSFYDGSLDYNLMIAASKGYSLEIERLVKKGADPNAQTSEGVTPLIFAITSNHAAIVNMLLKLGADVNKVTTRYETPLIIAVKGEMPDIAEALIRGGADIDFSDKHDATALHYASINGYFQLVDLLLYYGASVDKKSVEGTTPLLASIWAGYDDVSDILIQNGANMEARDNEGFTPFLMASYFGDTILIDLLYKKGVDIYEKNNSNHNALTLSIIAGNSETTKFLLKLGKNWTDSGRTSLNPYVVASKYGRKDIIAILEKNNISGHVSFKVDQASVTASARFFVKDMFTGISFSFKEPYLNAGIIAGCDTKLWYTKILEKKEDHLFYQFRSKGSVAYAGLFKDFSLTNRPNRFNTSFSTTLLAGYSFGNTLKGTDTAPENKFIVIPSVALKMTKMNLSFNVGLEYIKTPYYNNGPLWLRIGCSYNYYFDKIRTRIKTIKWY
jgi:ankyrin repeat protein